MILQHAWLKDLNCRGLTGQASKPYNSIGMHFVYIVGLLKTFHDNKQLHNKISCSVNSHILASN